MFVRCQLIVLEFNGTCLIKGKLPIDKFVLQS